MFHRLSSTCTSVLWVNKLQLLTRSTTRLATCSSARSAGAPADRPIVGSIVARCFDGLGACRWHDGCRLQQATLGEVVLCQPAVLRIIQ